MRLSRQQHALIKALKKLTNAFEDKLLKKKEDTQTGFNNVSVQNVIWCLYNRFGKVTPNKLEQAKKDLNKSFNPCKLFSTFMCKIEDAVNIAKAANCLFITQQIIH